MNKIFLEDCLSGMKKLSDKMIDIVVTSPPYNIGINYNNYKDNKNIKDYLAWLEAIFIECKRVLKDDGHLWVNMGYSNINPWQGIDVANVLRKHYILQNNIVWVKSIDINGVTKGHFKPINSERFANTTWEHLFHFTKTGKVRCDRLAIGVPYTDPVNINDRESRKRGKLIKKLGYKNKKEFDKNATKNEKNWVEETLKKLDISPKPSVRCRGNTWYIPYETIKNTGLDRGGHPATFPVKLVDNCIKFSGIKTGVLMDPFMGTGTSAIAAIQNGLDYIGYEIDPDYHNFALERIDDFLNT
jgi:site-specific DNA-methyltransferase (adenine-specific)